MGDPVVTEVADRAGVERARRVAQELAASLAFGRADAECVAIAVSELGTNLVRHASGGAIEAGTVDGPSGTGVRIESRDRGPGIADVARALEDGYSTGGGLGGGLPAVVRLMDEVAIATGPAGTRITATKWPTGRS